MNQNEYKDFYNRVGAINGWDFSRVKSVTEGQQWDFYSEVLSLCKKTDILLDIGTGGGEAILKIAPALMLVIGIDYSQGMIKTALNIKTLYYKLEVNSNSSENIGQHSELFKFQ